MKKMKLEQKQMRRSYYYWSFTLIFIIVSVLSFPTFFNIRQEFQNKITQLSESIIDQKKIYLRSVIVEKISDVDRLRMQLQKEYPDLKQEDFDRIFRQEVKNIIYHTDLPDDGYIWINEIVNYSGGDHYAFRFAHPNLKDTEGDFLSTNAIDIRGNLPYRDELNGINARGSVYLDYYFQKMNSEEISHKISYVQLYPMMDWAIGTGVYLDDVDLLVEKETAKMRKSTNLTLLRISSTIILSLLILVFLVILFEKRLQHMIDGYVDTVQESNKILIEEKKKLEEAYQQIEEMAFTDFLTGLLNRRALLNDLELEVSRMKREESQFALLMCDIDFFKKVNDTYGHETGDEVLKEISRLMKETFRKEDRLCRWGGEEFLCLVTNCDREKALESAEKLRKKVENHPFTLKGNSLKLTLTIGIALFDPALSLETLIDISDEKLYQGKSQGRNRSVI